MAELASQAAGSAPVAAPASSAVAVEKRSCGRDEVAAVVAVELAQEAAAPAAQPAKRGRAAKPAKPVAPAAPRQGKKSPQNAQLQAAAAAIAATEPAAAVDDAIFTAAAAEEVADELAEGAAVKLHRAEEAVAAATAATPAKAIASSAMSPTTTDVSAGTNGGNGNGSRPAPSSPLVPIETPLVQFFRSFPCAPLTAPPIDHADGDESWVVDGRRVEAGSAVTVPPRGGAAVASQVAVCHGRVVAVRVVPTLPSEGVWFSVLTRGRTASYVSLWQCPPLAAASPDTSDVGAPVLRCTLHAGADEIVAFEWVPLAVHDANILGFASIVKAAVVMSGSMPRVADGRTCSVRICGMTQLNKDLDPVAARWVAGTQRELERTYLVVLHRCSTAIVYNIVYRNQAKQLILSPRHRYPPPRSAIPVPLGEAPPIAVGAKSNGDTFVAIGHGTVMTIIDGGSQLLSVTQLAARITALGATPRGVYCSLADGQTTYVRLQGREHPVDQLTIPDVPVANCARTTDVLVASRSGALCRWSPPDHVVPLWRLAVDVASHRVEVQSAPSDAIVLPPGDAAAAGNAAAAAFDFAFHPFADGKQQRFCVVRAANNVIAVAHIPLAERPAEATQA